MKKKNGFTLIELLAVLIILGLIAIITIPRVSEQIESSKKSTIKASVLSYTKTIKEYILQNQLNKIEINLSGTYLINSNGYLVQNTTIHEIKFEGEKPKGGSLVFNDNEITSGCVTLNKYKVTFQYGEINSVVKGSCE